MADNREYISRAEEGGSINISEDVISVIAAAAVAETEGVSPVTNSLGKEIAELLGKKNVSKGVKVAVEDSEVTVDICVMMKYGCTITDISRRLQDTVSESVEATTGLTVKAVNVHICGVDFGKSEK